MSPYLEAALAAARRETVATLAALSPEQLAEPVTGFGGQTRARATRARLIAVHHS